MDATPNQNPGGGMDMAALFQLLQMWHNMQNPQFVQQMNQQLQAAQLAGESSPLTAAAVQGTQDKAAMDQIYSLMKNPADMKAYAGFDKNPANYLPRILQQERDASTSFDQAREQYIQRHGGIAKLSAQRGPSHGTTEGKDGSLLRHGYEDYSNFVKGEEYLPEALRRSHQTEIPSYMLSRELEWRQQNPQYTGEMQPGGISSKDLGDYSKFIPKDMQDKVSGSQDAYRKFEVP